MSRVIQFLQGNGPDHKGRVLDDILKLDDQWWDECHDFIQWLFPLPKASNFFVGEDCPVISFNDMVEMRTSIVIRGNLENSTEKFLKFLGFKLWIDKDGDYDITIAENFSEQANYWLRANDHNHLRINRMLQCLILAKMENLAKEIFCCLVMIKCEFADCITDATMVYWRNALTGYSY